MRKQWSNPHFQAGFQRGLLQASLAALGALVGYLLIVEPLMGALAVLGLAMSWWEVRAEQRTMRQGIIEDMNRDFLARFDEERRAGCWVKLTYDDQGRVEEVLSVPFQPDLREAYMDGDPFPDGLPVDSFQPKL